MLDLRSHRCVARTYIMPYPALRARQGPVIYKTKHLLSIYIYIYYSLILLTNSSQLKALWHQKTASTASQFHRNTAQAARAP